MFQRSMRKASLKGARNFALEVLKCLSKWRKVNSTEIMKANETPKPADPYLLPQLEATLGRGLFNIVLGSTCLALGCMAAALQALRRGPSGFTFRLSAGTFVAFGVGLAAGCLYWKLTSGALWPRDWRGPFCF